MQSGNSIIARHSVLAVFNCSPKPVPTVALTVANLHTNKTFSTTTQSHSVLMSKFLRNLTSYGLGLLSDTF